MFDLVEEQSSFQEGVMEKGKWLTDKYWVAPMNYAEEVRAWFDLPERVYIHDVTLREAEQAPHVALRPEEKIRIYEALDELGVHSVEIFPIVSEEDTEVAKELVRLRKTRKTKVYFLCRWHKEEVDFALEVGADGVIIEGTADPWFAKVNLGVTADEMYKRYVETTAHAKRNGIFTVVMPWDTCRAPLDFVERLYKGIVYEGGADHIVVADTHGSSLPWAIYAFIKKVRSWVPGVPVEMHCHNDCGLATAIMLSAIAAGAQVVHTSFCSLGERVGNAATEEVALDVEMLLGIPTGIKLEKLYPTAQMIAEMAKMPIARNKPIVGENEFTYESGMVVYVIEKMAALGERPYSVFLPELIGRRGYKVVIGKGTGKSVVAKKLEQLGIKVNQEQLGEITRRIKREAGLRKWSLPDEAIEAIAREVLESWKE